jgi:hypothetical protein
VRYFAPLLTAVVLAVVNAAAVPVKSGRRYRGRHARRGIGRHGRPRGSDLVDRVLCALSALARVDVWILIATVAGVVVATRGVIIGYLTLVKPG